jgi:hypothetical protein
MSTQEEKKGRVHFLGSISYSLLILVLILRDVSQIFLGQALRLFAGTFSRLPSSPHI